MSDNPLKSIHIIQYSKIVILPIKKYKFIEIFLKMNLLSLCKSMYNNINIILFFLSSYLSIYTYLIPSYNGVLIIRNLLYLIPKWLNIFKYFFIKGMGNNEAKMYCTVIF